jgi:hypothetical protein
MYKLQKRTGVIKRISDNAGIPEDPENSDRRAYDAWVALGNTPLPADEDPPLEAFDARVQRRIMDDPAMRALIRVLANRFGMTPAQLIDAMKAASD